MCTTTSSVRHGICRVQNMCGKWTKHLQVHSQCKNELLRSSSLCRAVWTTNTVAAYAQHLFLLASCFWNEEPRWSFLSTVRKHSTLQLRLKDRVFGKNLPCLSLSWKWKLSFITFPSLWELSHRFQNHIKKYKTFQKSPVSVINEKKRHEIDREQEGIYGRVRRKDREGVNNMIIL